MNLPQDPERPQHLVPHVVDAHSLPTVEHTPGGYIRIVHGVEHGLGDISLLFSFNPPGGGPAPHKHDYVETFVLTEGRGIYTVGGKDFEAEVGDVVVVPAGEWHSFTNSGQVPLVHTSVHQAPRIVSERPPTG